MAEDSEKGKWSKCYWEKRRVCVKPINYEDFVFVKEEAEEASLGAQLKSK